MADYSNMKYNDEKVILICFVTLLRTRVISGRFRDKDRYIINRYINSSVYLLTYLLDLPPATLIIMIMDLIICNRRTLGDVLGWLITRLINYTLVPSLLSTGYPQLHVLVTVERRLSDAVTSTINGPSTLRIIPISATIRLLATHRRAFCIVVMHFLWWHFRFEGYFCFLPPPRLVSK